MVIAWLNPHWCNCRPVRPLNVQGDVAKLAAVRKTNTASASAAQMSAPSGFESRRVSAYAAAQDSQRCRRPAIDQSDFDCPGKGGGF